MRNYAKTYEQKLIVITRFGAFTTHSKQKKNFLQKNYTACVLIFSQGFTM